MVNQPTFEPPVMFTGNPQKFTGFPVGIVEAEIDRLLAFSKRLQPTEPVIDLDAPTAERLPEAESSKGRQTMGVGDWMVIYGDFSWWFHRDLVGFRDLMVFFLVI